MLPGPVGHPVLFLARGGLVCACYEWWVSFQMLCSPYASTRWFFATRQDAASSRGFTDPSHSIEASRGPHFTFTGPWWGKHPEPTTCFCSSLSERVNICLGDRQALGPKTGLRSQVRKTRIERLWVLSLSLFCFVRHNSNREFSLLASPSTWIHSFSSWCHPASMPPGLLPESGTVDMCGDSCFSRSTDDL